MICTQEWGERPRCMSVPPVCCENVASLQLHCLYIIFSYGKPKSRTKGQLVAGSPQPWSGRYPVGTGSPHMGEEWEQQVLTGHLEPGGHRVTERQLGASQDCWPLPPLPMSLTNGKVLRISFLIELRQSLRFIWHAPEHLNNNCRPSTVGPLTSTSLRNTNSVGKKLDDQQNKKQTIPTCHHISCASPSQVLASSRCYFPHEHSLPRPTFLSARPSAEHLPCARKKRRRRGLLQT